MDAYSLNNRHYYDIKHLTKLDQSKCIIAIIAVVSDYQSQCIKAFNKIKEGFATEYFL